MQMNYVPCEPSRIYIIRFTLYNNWLGKPALVRWLYFLHVWHLIDKFFLSSLQACASDMAFYNVEFFVQDGHPPLGWYDTAAYLVLPVLLVASQYFSMELMKPPQVKHEPLH
jgi:hypothetical protein